MITCRPLLYLVMITCIFVLSAALTLAAQAQYEPPVPPQPDSYLETGRPAPMRMGFVARLDRDGDNQVSREEFDGPPERFDDHDQNGDGYLTEDERPRFLPPGRRPPLPPQRMQVNPAPAQIAEVQQPAAAETPAVLQPTAEKGQTPDSSTNKQLLLTVIFAILTALVLATLWGIYSSRKLKQVKDAIESLNPHLLGVNLDNNIIITEVTEALCKATGFKGRELVGKPLMALGSHTADTPGALHDMWNKIKRGVPWKGEVKLICKNGNIIWADAVISPLRRKREVSTGYTVFYQDISKRKHFEKLSLRDELTGLFNRRYFNEVAPAFLEQSQEEDRLFVLCILDVDNFKKYNDTYGHPAGDRVLASIARTLMCVYQRKDDMVFRLGGEEFGFIFAVDDAAEATSLAEKTLSEIRNLNITHKKNSPGIVTVSMGLHITSAAAGEDIDSIYKSADQALYEAKQTGRDSYIVKGA